MTEKTPAGTDFIQWLQRKYIQVPGNVYVSAKDVYESYVIDKKDCVVGSLLAKKQVSQIVPALLGKVTIVRHHGNIFKGLRLNFYDEQTCSEENLKTLASEHGFFQVPTFESNTKYSVHTGYHINRNEQFKSVIIKPDKSFDVTVGCMVTELSIIGLQDMKINTINDANIVFNTVKRARVCRGKLVASKLNTTKFGVVQEWYKPGEENGIELRLSARKCQGVVSFTAYYDTCPTCACQKFPIHTNNKEDGGEESTKKK